MATTVERLLTAPDKPFKPSARWQRALNQDCNVTLSRSAMTLADRLRGRATEHLSTDEIMQLTRGA